MFIVCSTPVTWKKFSLYIIFVYSCKNFNKYKTIGNNTENDGGRRYKHNANI